LCILDEHQDEQNNMLPSLVLTLAAVAAAAPAKDITIRQSSAAQEALLLVGGGSTGTISAVSFDGVSFNIVGNNTIEGSAPSWLAFKEPNLLYAVDESSNVTRVFNVGHTPQNGLA
jgi:hypothetical protein